MTEQLQIEATGETVGEAKWSALRELEKLQPGLDKASVKFQVISEGERGLLGVGFAPARVLASVDADGEPGPVTEAVDESELAATVRDLLERIVGEIWRTRSSTAGRWRTGRRSWSTRPATASDGRPRSTRSLFGVRSG